MGSASPVRASASCVDARDHVEWILGCFAIIPFALDNSMWLRVYQRSEGLHGLYAEVRDVESRNGDGDKVDQWNSKS